MKDLDELALAMPEATKEVEDGRPTYAVHGKFFCFHRSARPDAVDRETGERLTDVLVFRVADAGEKEAILQDDRGAVLHHAALERLQRGASSGFRISRSSTERSSGTSLPAPG